MFEILEEKRSKSRAEKSERRKMDRKMERDNGIDLSQWEDQTKIDLQDTKDQLYYYQYYVGSM